MPQKILVLDTEDCNINKDLGPVPGNNLPYDIGYHLVEPATGKITEKHSYVIPEIFYGEEERMQSAYFADKIPQYKKDIAEGKRKMKSFFEVLNEIAEICKREKVTAICAHNARFDVDALNRCVEWLTGYRIPALPQNVEIWDTMKMWNACKPKKYTTFCDANGYKTKHTPPRDRLTAEIIYRFLTGDNDFSESHTGLEDVEIETEILLACFKTHKKMAEERVLYHAKA